MNNKLFSTMKLVPLAFVFMLSACGGGGDVAGGATEFSVSPNTLKLTTSNSTCTVSGTTTSSHTVIGGTPPYRLVNSFPNAVYVSHTTLDGKNPTFQVRPLGGCGDSLTVLVIDYHSRVATLTVTVEAAEAE